MALGLSFFARFLRISTKLDVLKTIVARSCSLKPGARKIFVRAFFIGLFPDFRADRISDDTLIKQGGNDIGL
jgi:hypothetical protein